MFIFPSQLKKFQEVKRKATTTTTTTSPVPPTRPPAFDWNSENVDPSKRAIPAPAPAPAATATATATTTTTTTTTKLQFQVKDNTCSSVTAAAHTAAAAAPSSAVSILHDSSTLSSPRPVLEPQNGNLLDQRTRVQRSTSSASVAFPTNNGTPLSVLTQQQLDSKDAEISLLRSVIAGASHLGDTFDLHTETASDLSDPNLTDKDRIVLLKGWNYQLRSKIMLIESSTQQQQHELSLLSTSTTSKLVQLPSNIDMRDSLSSPQQQQQLEELESIITTQTSQKKTLRESEMKLRQELALVKQQLLLLQQQQHRSSLDEDELRLNVQVQAAQIDVLKESEQSLKQELSQVKHQHHQLLAQQEHQQQIAHSSPIRPSQPIPIHVVQELEWLRSEVSSKNSALIAGAQAVAEFKSFLSNGTSIVETPAALIQNGSSSTTTDMIMNNIQSCRDGVVALLSELDAQKKLNTAASLVRHADTSSQSDAINTTSINDEENEKILPLLRLELEDSVSECNRVKSLLHDTQQEMKQLESKMAENMYSASNYEESISSSNHQVSELQTQLQQILESNQQQLTAIKSDYTNTVQIVASTCIGLSEWLAKENSIGGSGSSAGGSTSNQLPSRLRSISNWLDPAAPSPTRLLDEWADWFKRNIESRFNQIIDAHTIIDKQHEVVEDLKLKLKGGLQQQPQQQQQQQVNNVKFKNMETQTNMDTTTSLSATTSSTDVHNSPTKNMTSTTATSSTNGRAHAHPLAISTSHILQPALQRNLDFLVSSPLSAILQSHRSLTLGEGVGEEVADEIETLTTNTTRKSAELVASLRKEYSQLERINSTLTARLEHQIKANSEIKKLMVEATLSGYAGTPHSSATSSKQPHHQHQSSDQLLKRYNDVLVEIGRMREENEFWKIKCEEMQAAFDVFVVQGVSGGGGLSNGRSIAPSPVLPTSPMMAMAMGSAATATSDPRSPVKSISTTAVADVGGGVSANIATNSANNNDNNSRGLLHDTLLQLQPRVAHSAMSMSRSSIDRHHHLPVRNNNNSHIDLSSTCSECADRPLIAI